MRPSQRSHLVQCLDRSCCPAVPSFVSGEADVWGRADGVADWTLTRCAFTRGSNDTAEVRGSFQETAPRKTAENTLKHCDGSVDSVVANHRIGGESSMVATTIIMA